MKTNFWHLKVDNFIVPRSGSGVYSRSILRYVTWEGALDKIILFSQGISCCRGFLDQGLTKKWPFIEEIN